MSRGISEMGQILIHQFKFGQNLLEIYSYIKYLM